MSGKKQILLLFILLLTLCACKPKPLSYEITFQKEEALEQVFDELAFSEDRNELVVHGFFNNTLYFSKWHDDASMIGQTKLVWKYDFDTQEYAEVLTLKDHLRVQDLVELEDGTILYTAVKSGEIDYLTPYTVEIHFVEKGKDNTLRSGLTWNYIGTPMIYMNQNGCHLNLFTMTDYNEDYTTFLECYHLYRFRNHKLELVEYGAYQVNNNSITPNQGDRFWSNLGTMAVNHDQLFYLIKHDDTIALNYGKIKMNTLPLDFSPNGMYEATDDYFITTDNLMKNVTYRLSDMEKLYFPELDGCCNGDLVAFDNGLLAVKNDDNDIFRYYFLKDDRLTPIQTDFPQDTRYHILHDHTHMIIHTYNNHTFYRISLTN